MPAWTPVDRGQLWSDNQTISRSQDDDGTYTERAYARSFGWDSTNLTWRRLKVDATGALATTGGASGGGGIVTQGARDVTAQAWLVDGSGVTQPISAAAFTDGTQKAIVRGGVKGTTTAADVTSTASGVNHQPLDVAVYDAAGNLKDPTQIRALTSADVVSAVQSGTWTVAQGTAAAASAAWPHKLVDSAGVNVATVKAASTAIAATDLPLAVGLHPSSPLPAGVNAIGSVTQGSPPWQVGGNVASGAADSGNPVKAGGAYNTTPPTVTTGQRVDLQATNRGALLIGIRDEGTDASVARVVQALDGNSSGLQGVISVAYNECFNGSTWDRLRGNFDTTTGDTGAKTATFAGATQTNYNARGAIITIRLGTVSGTSPTLTAQLQWSPDGGTTWLTAGPASGTATATNNTIAVFVYPTNTSQAAGVTPANLTTGATQTLALNMALPRTWRLNYTIAGTTPSFAITAVNVNYIR